MFSISMESRELLDLILSDKTNSDIFEKYFENIGSFTTDGKLYFLITKLEITSLLSLYNELITANKVEGKLARFCTLLDSHIEIEMEHIEDEMETMNPSQFFKKYKTIFSHFLSNKVKTIKKGSTLYRSRRGYHKIPYDDGFASKDHFFYPWFGDQISNPPINLANSNRFNRENYSYLYLTNNIETALAELRPESGELCSISQFKSIKNLELLDLTINYPFENLVLRSKTESWKIYYFSQFISDIAKDLKRDGIWYRSSQAKGYCSVIFKPKNFQIIRYSEELFKIKSICVDYIHLEKEKENTTDLVKYYARNKQDGSLYSPIKYNHKILDYIKSNKKCKKNN